MAYDFDGTDDFIEAALGANYDQPKTLACWFNSDDSTVAFTLMSLSLGSTAENLSPALALRLSTGAAVLATSAAAGGLSNASTTNTYTQSTWHHAAATFSSNSIRTAYLDAIGTSQNVLRATGGSLDNLILGQGSGGTYNPANPFNGRIAEAAVWDVALNAAEINALYRGYRPSLIRPDSLLFYLPLIRQVQDVASGISFTDSATGPAVHTRRIG